MTLTQRPDGGWVWFTDPRAIYANGRTFVGFITGAGHVKAGQWDHAAGTWKAACLYIPNPPNPPCYFEIDDHDNPALLRRSSDGRLLAGFTTHLGYPYLNISANPDDASSWQGVVNLGPQLGGPFDYTYCHLVEFGGLIWYFTRRHDATGLAWTCYSTSGDGGLTWTAVAQLYPRTYAKVAADASAIHLALSDHPTYEPTSSIWDARWDGAWSTPELVYDGSASRAWVYDRTPDVIAFQTFDAYPSGRRYKAAVREPGGWAVRDLGDAGGSISTPWSGNPDGVYVGGIALAADDIAFVSVPVAGQWEICRYTTTDAWQTYAVEQLTEGSASKQLRPVAVKDAHPDLPVVWLHGRYTTYVDFDQGIGSPLAPPAPPPPTGWQIVGEAVPFQNGWTHYDSATRPVRFRKLDSGLVVLEGTMRAGVAGATAFTLPEGFRPSQQITWPQRATFSANVYRQLYVEPSGAIKADGSAGNAYVALYGSWIA